MEVGITDLIVVGDVITVVVDDDTVVEDTVLGITVVVDVVVVAKGTGLNDVRG